MGSQAAVMWRRGEIHDDCHIHVDQPLWRMKVNVRHLLDRGLFAGAGKMHKRRSGDNRIEILLQEEKWPVTLWVWVANRQGWLGVRPTSVLLRIPWPLTASASLFRPVSKHWFKFIVLRTHSQVRIQSRFPILEIKRRYPSLTST